MFGIDRRQIVQGLGAALGSGLTASVAQARSVPLEERIGQMLLLGFIGSDTEAPGADNIAAHLDAGRIGGVLFLRHNVRQRENVERLTARFAGAAPTAWMAVDQEGGVVQRLSRDLGFTAIPRARRVAAASDIAAARSLYGLGAAEFRAAGFNMNLAPVADLHDPDNAVIGQYGRAFGDDAATVAEYASVFIDMYDDVGAACAIKHFPGHGRSRSDSHHGFVDISGTWDERELDPFRQLIAARKAHLMMGGHLIHRGLDASGVPVTFSRPVLTDLLRSRLGFQGVVMTDDLDMAAIAENFEQREAVLRSIQAGNDIIMMSNSRYPDPDLPQRFAGWVLEAIESGRISEAHIDASVARIHGLKQRIGLI